MPDKPQTLMGVPIVFVDDMPPMPEIVLFSMPDGEFIFPVEQVRQMQALGDDRLEWQGASDT